MREIVNAAFIIGVAIILVAGAWFWHVAFNQVCP